jgi:hypothetical protein
VIEVTDEMVQEMWPRIAGDVISLEDIREGLAAVLAIVARDYGDVGPCSTVLPGLASGPDVWCELRHGHTGDHENGPTRWKERA